MPTDMIDNVARAHRLMTAFKAYFAHGDEPALRLEITPNGLIGRVYGVAWTGKTLDEVCAIGEAWLRKTAAEGKSAALDNYNQELARERALEAALA